MNNCTYLQSYNLYTVSHSTSFGDGLANHLHKNIRQSTLIRIILYIQYGNTLPFIGTYVDILTCIGRASYIATKNNVIDNH